MKNKNIVYGLLALLGIYLVTKKKGSDDSTSGGTSDVGNGSNDVDRANTPTDVPVKTPVVEVNTGGTKDTPLDVRADFNKMLVNSGGVVNSSNNAPSTGSAPQFRF